VIWWRMRVIDVSKQVRLTGLTNSISTVIEPKLDSCHVKLTLVTPLRSKTPKLDILSRTAYATSYLRLKYTFRSAIFFKFGFLIQSNGLRVISNFWKQNWKNLMLVEKWRFYVMAGSKSSLLIESLTTCMQSTETNFVGILPIWILRIGWLLS